MFLIIFITASYQFSRQVVWISVSSSLLLFAPVMFEVERFNVEEMVKQDRNRVSPKFILQNLKLLVFK